MNGIPSLEHSLEIFSDPRWPPGEIIAILNFSLSLEMESLWD